MREGAGRRPPGVGRRSFRGVAAASLVAVVFATACATPHHGDYKNTAEFKDTGGPVSWAIDRVTVQSYANGRMKWLYRLRFRETSGVGAVLYYVKREERVLGETPGTSEWDVRLEIGPHDEVRVDCAYAIVPGPVSPRRYEVDLKQTYLGRDGRGIAFEVPIQLVLDRSAPAREQSRLDFARFSARSVAAVTPSCEAIPEETVVFDLIRQNTIHFFIAMDNTGGRVSVRTRWLTPSGKLAHVILDDIDTGVFPRDLPFIAVRHSVTRQLVQDEPGTWNVELFLADTSYGLFPFQVWRGP
jgi:hypothetical protein